MKPFVLSGKQKRSAIMARRKIRREQANTVAPTPVVPRPKGSVLVNPAALAANNSYGQPEFLRRGYYEDLCFICRDCGAKQVWLASQQQWWFETAKGYVYSTAVRCLNCRRERRLAGQRIR
ncbi:zinc-ribbon domain containing protein [Andreprevotia chitinilytica]|uniref:zinc-ribbon domain containing protein n=1 Tax=Andreprevotia chitinilytica TaxID=396808 RepID=UPI001FE1472B|nr:zinc-ribbon domain containing protein [Andreprevotia chitinilytica]